MDSGSAGGTVRWLRPRLPPLLGEALLFLEASFAKSQVRKQRYVLCDGDFCGGGHDRHSSALRARFPRPGLLLFDLVRAVTRAFAPVLVLLVGDVLPVVGLSLLMNP